MMRSLLIDTVEASSLLLFRYQWLATLLPDHICTFVIQASQDIRTTPLPRVLLAAPAFHWKGKTQGRLLAIKKLVEADPAAIWVSHQSNWQLSDPAISLWTSQAYPTLATQLPLPVSPWAEPPEWEYLAAICESEAGGHAYFFCMAEGLTELQLIQLLKAFSLFKKWQQSSLQLIISWNPGTRLQAGLLKQIETYKYRNDLHFKSGLDAGQLARLILGAYAFLYYGDTNHRDWILTAATLDVPVIAAPQERHSDYWGDSMHWISTQHWEQIGQTMIQLYRDEAHRNACIRSAGERAKPWTHPEIGRRWLAALNN